MKKKYGGVQLILDNVGGTFFFHPMHCYVETGQESGNVSRRNKNYDNQ